jgi:hypothetical protein
MIKPTRAFVASDGTAFPELKDAQIRELRILFFETASGDQLQISWEDVAKHIMANRDRVMDILNTGSRSRPATRKINGASRKPRGAATPKAAPAT